MIESQELEFLVTNNDSDPHQPLVIRSSADPASLSVMDGHVDLNGVFVLWPGGGQQAFSPGGLDIDQLLEEWRESGLLHTIEPGQTITEEPLAGSPTEPGSYVILCFLAGHYENGEATVLEVQG